MKKLILFTIVSALFASCSSMQKEREEHKKELKIYSNKRSIPESIIELNSIASRPEEPCGDILARIKLKPSGVSFVECNKGRSQVVVIKSEYKLSGMNAKRVENYFKKTLNLPSMLFACCGWGASVWFKDSEGFSYQLELFSSADENSIFDKKKREYTDFEYFHIWITKYLEPI